MDELLESLGLKYEDLTSAERETYQNWYEKMSEAAISPADILNYIVYMRESVEHELSKYDNTKEKDNNLKARMKNYLLLEAFLNGPDKAKKALESYIGSITRNKA